MKTLHEQPSKPLPTLPLTLLTLLAYIFLGWLGLLIPVSAAALLWRMRQDSCFRVMLA
jgi:hypothetical protein